MKLTDKEFFFTSEGLVDSKHILNTNPDMEIDIGYLDLLEKEGVTLEQLKEFEDEGLDIFRYKTQITIHGIFPKLKSKRLGDYKSLIENKNRSIGVKWRAIDLDKKHHIFDILKRYIPKLSLVSSSKDLFLRRISFIESQSDLESKLIEFKEIANKFDKTLFYGQVVIYGAKYAYSNILVLELHLNAIEESKIPEFITKATGVKYKVIMDIINGEKIKATKAEAFAKKQKEIIKLAKEEYIKENVLSKGFIFCTDYKVLKPGDIIFALSTYINQDGSLARMEDNYFLVIREINHVKYVRMKDENDTDPEINRTFKVRDLANKSFYYKPKVKVEMKVNDKPSNIRVVDYSEKAIAVYGDTKQYRGELKNMGGKFNFKLKDGAGWIFKASKKKEILTFFNL